MYVCMDITYSRVQVTPRSPRDSMCVCMYAWTSHIAEYRSTGEGCQSCSWSAEQRKQIFGLARRVRPSRPAVACSFSTLRLNLVLTRGTHIPPVFRSVTRSVCVCVCVFLTLTDRTSTLPSNIRGCQSGMWYCWTGNDQRNIYKAPTRAINQNRNQYQ